MSRPSPTITPPSASRRVSGRALAGGTAVRLAVAVSVAAALIGGCTGRGLPIPTPAPSTGPSVAATSAPAESASPDAPSAVDAFRALVTSGSLTYRIAVKGDVLATVSDLTIKGSIAVAGKNVATSTSYVFDDGFAASVDTRYVGGAYWVRAKGSGLSSAWEKAKNVSAVVAPFLNADAPAAISDFGPRTVNGKTVRSLQVLGGRLLDPFTIPAINLSEERVTSSILQLNVDANGRPLSGHWKQTGQGRVSGQLQEIDVDVDVTFSDVGGKVSVTAP